MATQATNIHGLAGRNEGFWAGIATGLNNYMNRKSRVDQVQKLEAKTDEELAAMGLKRDDITRYVFRDMFYI